MTPESATTIFPDSTADPSSVQVSDTAGHRYISPDTSFRFNDISPTTEPLKSGEKEEIKTYIPFFKHHELQIKNQYPIPIVSSNPIWLFYVLLILVAGFTWVKVFYSRTLEHILGSFLSKTTSNQIVRDENLLLQKASFLLTGIFYLVFAMFIYQLSNFYNFIPDFFPTGLLRFLILAVFVSGIYSFKLFLLKITGFIFQLDKPISAYIFNVFLINNLVGILFLPIVIAVAFTTTFAALILIKIAIAVFIILYIFRLIRGIMIGLNLTNFNLFYLFLYICSLEIAPLVLIVKMANVS
jgi:hypothetical protein